MKNDKQVEQRRLDILKSLDILNTEPELVFDQITRCAADICDMPMAAITLIDENRLWFKSALGLDLRETRRSVGFCNHAIRLPGAFVVPDTALSPAFRDNPLVAGEPWLRFYAGFPLRSREGVALGALAVMDRIPRSLDDKQMRILLLLADQVMALLEMRRQRRDLQALVDERERMNVQLRGHAQHLREAQCIAGVSGWEVHAGSRRFECSAELAGLLGLGMARWPDTLAGFLRAVHADDREPLLAAIEQALDCQRPLDAEHRIVRADGAVRHVRQRAEFRIRGQGERVLVGTAQDVTAQHEAQESLRLLHTCIARINDAVMITEASQLEEPGPRILFVNEAFERLSGYRGEEVTGRSPRMLQGPGTSRFELDRIRMALMRREPVDAELLNYRRDGQPFWVECSISPVVNEDGGLDYYVSVQRDISERKRAEAEIERLAFYDPLTRLPNRRLLMDRLQHAVETARRSGCTGALIFLDVDNFKTLNDTVGHDKGDLLLQQIAQRLESCVRRSNTVGRLGGDEFVIILEELAPEETTAAVHAEVVIKKILAAFTRNFQFEELEFQCTPSMGVAMFNRQQDDVDDLLKRADLAMYQAKAAGKNTACFFDPAMQASINARVALERELRAALQRQEFVLHYQPQKDGAGNTMGAEALVRWRHPQRGLVFPNNFIGLAEETGLILPLGQWVMESACRQLNAWAAQSGAANWSMSVNVSASQFRHPEFVDTVLAVVEHSGADPRKLKLELTETVLIERPEDTIAKMSRLRDRGIGFSLDDFGTGYSSLSYLKRLPLDQLKIDRSFVKDVLTDPNDAAIARTILALGQILGLQVVAEGVESGDQRDFLAALGCHAYQGYFFSHPLPAESM